MGFSSSRFSLRLPAILLLVALVACGCATEPSYPVRQPAVQARSTLPSHPGAHIAARLVGTPYRYGGATPRGFDCSGLVYYAYREAGFHVPRTTQAQLRHASRVPLGQLQPGDLLFFKLDRRPVSHVGIYSGKNRFIHAPSNGKQVSFTALSDPYWRTHLVAAGRYY